MYCTQCGAKINENDLFCSQCGHSVDDVKNEGMDKNKNPSEISSSNRFDGAKEEHKKDDTKAGGETKHNKGNVHSWKEELLGLFTVRTRKVFIKASSPAPLNDGLRKYNVIYVIMAVFLLIIGGVGGIIIGFLAAWALKTIIAGDKWYGLDRIHYEINNKPTKEEILKYLIPAIIPYGMFGEIGTESILVKRGGYKYEVSYTKDNHFIIIPGTSVLKEPSSFGRITRYKNAVIDMGIISYLVTCICDGNKEELERHTANCQVYANNYTKSRKETWKSVLVMMLIFLTVGIYFFMFMEPDYEDEVKNGVLYGTDCTVDVAFSDFFDDLTWDTYSSNTEGMYLVEAKGDCYFVLDNKSTPVECAVEFVYEPESGNLYVQRVKAGDRTYINDNDIYQFLQNVYGYGNMTTPNSISGILEGYGNALISGANNYLFGKYVSYDEGKALH